MLIQPTSVPCTLYSKRKDPNVRNLGGCYKWEKMGVGTPTAPLLVDGVPLEH